MPFVACEVFTEANRLEDANSARNVVPGRRTSLAMPRAKKPALPFILVEVVWKRHRMEQMIVQVVPHRQSPRCYLDAMVAQVLGVPDPPRASVAAPSRRSPRTRMTSLPARIVRFEPFLPGSPRRRPAGGVLDVDLASLQHPAAPQSSAWPGRGDVRATGCAVPQAVGSVLLHPGDALGAPRCSVLVDRHPARGGGLGGTARSLLRELVAG